MSPRAVLEPRRRRRRARGDGVGAGRRAPRVRDPADGVRSQARAARRDQSPASRVSAIARASSGGVKENVPGSNVASVRQSRSAVNCGMACSYRLVAATLHGRRGPSRANQICQSTAGPL